MYRIASLFILGNGDPEPISYVRVDSWKY